MQERYINIQDNLGRTKITKVDMQIQILLVLGIRTRTLIPNMMSATEAPHSTRDTNARIQYYYTVSLYMTRW